jgi:hypothetical protein
MFKKTLYLLFLVIVIISCVNTKNNDNSEQIETAVNNVSPEQMETAVQSDVSEESVIGYIDIPSPGFFWKLRTWKEGTLVTVDRNARFSEISFIGKNGMRIKPLVNFPRMALDNNSLRTYPEHDLIISNSARRFHVADIAAKKTKSFAPYLTGKHDESTPILMDGSEGIMIFPYYWIDDYSGRFNFFVVYNYKTDKIIKDIKIEEDMRLRYPLDSENLIASTRQYPLPKIDYIYNWRTGERTENELTKTTTKLEADISLSPLVNINLEKRFLFSKIYAFEKPNCGIITWEEGFTDVKVVPIGYLAPNKDKWFEEFLLSPDGQWANCFIGGYWGLFGEQLGKRVFFHLDGRYPNGISLPVFADGYYEYHWQPGAFVNHPVHGMCFAEEKLKKELFGERRYLRLYKMSDVLAEINRRSQEKTKDVLKE